MKLINGFLNIKRKDLWRPLAAALLALNMGACNPVVGFEKQNPPSPPAVTETYQPPLPTPQLSETPTPTPTPTFEPTSTPTPEPTLTPTLEPTPTNEVVQGVEQALTDWLNGMTKIAPEQLLLIPQSGERLPLGTIREYDPNKEETAHYQGVLLGTKTVDEQLILIIGFETKDGERYTLPFNAGPFENGLLVQVVQQRRWVPFWESDTVSQRIPVSELAQKLTRILGKTILFSSYFSLAGFPEDQVIEPVRKQLLPTIPIAQEVYYFVNQATVDGFPPPSERIEPLLNRIPTSVTTEDLPSVRYIQQTGDWVTTP